MQSCGHGRLQFRLGLYVLPLSETAPLFMVAGRFWEMIVETDVQRE